MTTRENVLAVTARLYADLGWRGTTTRRIAAEAGVNEVTLFRQFGTKESLLHEAIEFATRESASLLPEVPVVLETELMGWCIERYHRIQSKSGIIRASLAEWAERPDMPAICSGGAAYVADLRRYLGAARTHGLIGVDGSIEAACSVLVNTVFMDAMTRETLPGSYPFPVEQTIALLVDLVLRGLAATEIS